MADELTDAEAEAMTDEHFAVLTKEVESIDLATVMPMHNWNDPDGDGHTCIDCPPESIWKCDQRSHEYVSDPIERIIQHHLPVTFPNGSVMCLCHSSKIDGRFSGPVFHRRHVVGIIRAHLESKGF